MCARFPFGVAPPWLKASPQPVLAEGLIGIGVYCTGYLATRKKKDGEREPGSKLLH